MTRRGYLPPGEQHRARTPEPLGGLFAVPPADPEIERPGTVGRDHPDTAVDAARLVAPKAASCRARLIGFLAQRGAEGLTAAEATTWLQAQQADGAPPVSRNQTAARLLELRQQGWAEYVPDLTTGGYVTRETGGGATGRVHVLSEAGRIQHAVQETETPRSQPCPSRSTERPTT